jgi:hypothetical protein
MKVLPELVEGVLGRLALEVPKLVHAAVSWFSVNWSPDHA